jgi:hypothetical protein
MHPLHSSLEEQKLGQISVLAVSGAAAGLAEVDEAKAATTARTIVEETRIVCESCDLGPDDFEEDSRRTAGFYVLKNCYMKFILGRSCFQIDGHIFQCQQIAPRSPTSRYLLFPYPNVVL